MDQAIISGANGLIGYELTKYLISKNIKVIFDRKEAILESLESLVNSKPGSALLIAGKGNENYQEFKNGLRKDFSDFEVVMSFKNAI